MNPSSTSTSEVIPKRFLIATKGDQAKAKARYHETLAWRQQMQLDTILARRHPHFKAIKRNYLRYHYKTSLANEPVLYLRLGAINFKGLRQAGIALDDLIDNFLAVTEFLWQVVAKGDEDAKCIQVIDLSGLRLGDFTGEAVEYVRKTSGILEQHYPERCAHIYVANVPSWFDLIWTVVNGFLDPTTKEKITIVRGRDKLFDALCKRIAPQNLPPEYQLGVDATSSSSLPADQCREDAEGNLRPRSEEDRLLYDLMAFLNGDADAPTTNPLRTTGAIQSTSPVEAKSKANANANANAIDSNEMRPVAVVADRQQY